MNYDIFISYRREGGYETAHSISLYLKGKGYRVFFDIENLRGGNFNTQLLDIIEHCQDFILVLPENGLDRCVNEDDWVRQELAHAIKHEKRLIPVLLKDFHFPDDLPADIQEISKYQGVAASDINYMDAAYIKIEEYLISKRGISWRRHKGYILGVIAVLLLGGGIYGGYTWHEHKQFSAISADLANEMALPIVAINGMLGDVTALEQAWKQYTDDVKAAANNTAKLAQLERNYKQLLQHIEQKYKYTPTAIQLSEEEKNILRTQGVSLTDIEQYHSLAVGAFYQEMQNLLKQLLHYSSAENIHLSEALIEGNIELNLLSTRLGAESCYLYYLYVMSYLDPEATAPIKQELLTKLFNFAPIEIDKESQFYKNRHERLLTQLEHAIIKNEQQIPIEEAATQRAGQFIEKVGQVAEKKAALATKQDELAAAYARALKKFNLLPEDDQYMQWGKILKVVELTQNASDKVPMYAHLDHWLSEHMRICPESKAYAQAAQVYYRQLAAGQVEPCGIIVIGTKDDEPHPLYKIGDIITQRKGQTVKNVDEYAAQAKSAGADDITLLRLDESGKLQTIQTTLFPTEVLTGFLPLIPETP